MTTTQTTTDTDTRLRNAIDDLVQVTYHNGDRETCTTDHARACLSGHYDPEAEDWSLVTFDRTGRGVTPGAVYEVNAGDWNSMKGDKQ